MDLAKFVHLIKTKTLHFTRIDKFKDRFEGSYPVENLKDWEHGCPDVGDFKYYRKFACVSCWYESKHESALMWEIYGKDNQGIVICSTKEKLKDSLDNDELHFKEVKYIDFLREKADISIPYEAFLFKRIEFKSEHEFRVALFKVPKSEGFENGFPRLGSPEKQEGYPETGVDVPVDTQLLIEKIVLSPYSKRWYRNVIQDILSHYNLTNLTLLDSELGVDPIYPKG